MEISDIVIGLLTLAFAGLTIPLVIIVIRSKAEIYALKKENQNLVAENANVIAKYSALQEQHQIVPGDIASCGEDRMDQSEMDL